METAHSPAPSAPPRRRHPSPKTLPPQRLGARQTTTTDVPANWSLKPTGLNTGDQFRLIFLSSTKRNATATAIADYNTFIQTRAAVGHTDIQSYSTGFRVVGCTIRRRRPRQHLHHLHHVRQASQIYWLNGTKVADTYADFYDGVLGR